MIKDEWEKLVEALKNIGVKTYGTLDGNFCFRYNEFPLGLNYNVHNAVSFYTRWHVDYYLSLGNRQFIQGVNTSTINVSNDNFYAMSIEDAVNYVTAAKQLLQKSYPIVNSVHQDCMNGIIRQRRFIVFEGVDNSGKTTVSKEIQKLMPWFTWTKEPVFSTEQADRLNSDEYKGKDAKREVLFLESRLSQQNLYNKKPCLLDRYLWTGVAYAKAFSPSIYSFAEALYTNHNIFKKPDLYIFMDTPLESCYDREPALKKEPGRLERIRQAYRDTEHLIDTPIEYIDGSKSLAECINAVKTVIVNHFPDQIPIV